jgi:[ribosomal protein S5]-alanine N-acetyltransferase
MEPTVFLQTERLRLRSWTEPDYEPYFRMNANPRVRKYFPKLLSREESLEEISRIQKHIQDRGYGFFAAELKETNAFIGFIGFSHPSFEAYFTPCLEIGWRLDEKFWGNGYATEGAKKCLAAGAEQFGLREIFSFTSIHNTVSERVMIKIGMKKVGNFNHPSLPSDHWLCEHVLYKTGPHDLLR